MKTIIFLISFIFSLLTYADTALYQVKEGKFHKGGNLSVEVLESAETFKVKMKYDISKRAWVPVSADDLKGESVMDLPLQFRDERGYLELETLGEMKIPDAQIKFIKRVDVGNYKNAFLAEVLPSNGKSRVRVTYHPEAPAAGWARVEIIFISQVSMLNGYELKAELK